MKWFRKAEDETSSFLIDHPKVKTWSIWIGKFFLEALSAFIFAYGFRAFISPSLACVEEWMQAPVTSINALISGGASGIAQAIIKFIEMFLPREHLLEMETTLISIFYFVINIPLFLLAWFKISKQFAIFTLINVAFVSLFNQVIQDSWIYEVVNIYEDNLARTIFGGITTGLSSGLALMVGTSSGGIDIISMYISEKKSSSVGQYSVICNSITVLCFVIFSIIGLNTNPLRDASGEALPADFTPTVTMALYTLVYFFVSGKVIDVLNTKNKKQELQIFTTNETLPIVLIRAFPHSCTVVESRGAFTGRRNLMVYMVISRSEKKKAIQLIKAVDKLSFITVIDLNQVYGRFYIKPIE